MSERYSNDCPCCSGPLIQQVRHQTVQWYCLNCRQEMPNLEREMTDPETLPLPSLADPALPSLAVPETQM